MPTYTQTTLDDFTAQISQNLDDPSQVYWTVPELQFAAFESLNVWGALTNYWRTRGTFQTQQNVPYYDLNQQLTVLRSRKTPRAQIVKEIQYMLLENPDPTGAGGSGQVSIASIYQAIQRARNRFVLDCCFPYTIPNGMPPPVAPDGSATLPQSCMYLHRAAWQDVTSGTWTNLWRQDAWATDHDLGLFQPGAPVCYSESQLAPIQIQLSPVPVNAGQLEIVTVDSLQIDTTNLVSTFNVPDEWIHAVKYAALADLLGADSQLNDPVRADYASNRYHQAVTFARDARSIMRMTIGGVPVTIDSFAALDAGRHTWRNHSGKPDIAGVQYDFLALSQVPDQAYGISVDVVQSAPLPQSGADFMPVGYEDIPHLVDYCTHVLLFKCGGNEFKTGFSDYDDFMKAVAVRGAINAAKIQYLEPEMGQPQKDQRERKDKGTVKQ